MAIYISQAVYSVFLHGEVLQPIPSRCYTLNILRQQLHFRAYTADATLYTSKTHLKPLEIPPHIGGRDMK
jgi:hypothetical protein